MSGSTKIWKLLFGLWGVVAPSALFGQCCQISAQNQFVSCMHQNHFDAAYCQGLVQQSFSKCMPVYYLIGSVSGLAGATGPLVLSDNVPNPSCLRASGSTTTISTYANGTVDFSPHGLSNATAYNVTVVAAPPNLSCTVVHGSGSIRSSNVTNVAVTCSCPAMSAGFSNCTPALGSSVSNGENANLGYDISPATGNLFLAQTDIHARPAVGADLDFIRYYNSQGSGADIGFGPNWTHSYSWSIHFAGDQALITADTGAVITFTFDSLQSKWLPQPGEFGTLAGGRSSFTNGSPSVYTNKYGTQFAFDSAGRLTSIQPADNTAIVIAYSSGNQISSVSSGGMSLTFSYAGSHISAVSDPAGVVWSYGYQPLQLPHVSPPTLSQSGSGLLQVVSVAVPPRGRFPFLFSPSPTKLYAYTPQSFGSRTFTPVSGGSQLTGYAVLTAEPITRPGTSPTWPPPSAQEAILGLFSYSSPPVGLAVTSVVTEAASGVVSSQLLRDVQLTYQPNRATPAQVNQIVTTAKLNGGAKTIVSVPPAPGMWRLSSIASTAGTGTPGEFVSESWTWNSNLTVNTHRDGNNNVTLFGSYDARGNPTSITEAYGTPQARSTTFTYHPVLSRPLTVSTPSVSSLCTQPHTLTFDYDVDYDSNYNTDPTLPAFVHQIVESGCTSPGVTGTVDALETHVVQIQYDSENRVTSINGPTLPSPSEAQYEATYSYVPAHRTYDYDPSTGYLAHEYRSTGNSSGTILTTTFSNYDADGRLLQSADPNGTVTKTTYDLEGRILSAEVDAANGTQKSTQQFLRDLAGDLTARITPEGTIIQTEYDSALRPWRVSGQTSTGATIWSRVTDYDLWGQPIDVRLFAGMGPDEGFGCTTAGTEQLCEELGYDPFERLIAQHTLDPNTNAACGGPGIQLNCTRNYTYDNNGNQVTAGDLEYGNTTYQFDPLNRVVAITNPAGGIATLQYDFNDNMVARRDPGDPQNGGTRASGRVATYQYDDFGRVVAVASPDVGHQWYSFYDLAGNLLASEDSTGAVLNYQYDALDRRTAVISPLPNQSVSFLYDQTGSISSTNGTFANSLGRLTSIQAVDQYGNSVTDFFVYDYRGWTTREIKQRADFFGAFTSSFGYTWGDNHELTSLSFPTGVVAQYQYPTSALYAPAPRPSEVDLVYGGASHVLASGINYFADGRVQSLVFGSGNNVLFARNKRGEVTSINAGPSNTPIVQQLYTFDQNILGQVKAVNFFAGQSNAWNWTLGYNALGALASYTTDIRKSQTILPGGDVYSWTYDEVGNRTSETYNGGTRTFCFDANCDANYATNQLQSASGVQVLDAANPSAPGSILGLMSLSYDQNGNVAQDTVAYNTKNNSALTYDFYFNSRHHLDEIDQQTNNQLPSSFQQNSFDGVDRVSEIVCPNLGATGGFGFCASALAQGNSASSCSASSPPSGSQNGPPPGGTICPAGGENNGVPVSGCPCDSSAYSQVVCANGQGWLCISNTWTPGFENYCTATSEAISSKKTNRRRPVAHAIPIANPWTPTNGVGAANWGFFFYTRGGQLLEETEYRNSGAYGYPLYTYTDHVYLGEMELGRAISLYESQNHASDNPTSCSQGTSTTALKYGFNTTDMQYLYHDNRGALVAVESQNLPKPNPPAGLPHLVWEAEVSPFGQAVTVGLRGPSGRIGATDHQPDDIVAPGVGGALPDGQLGSFLVQSGGSSVVNGSHEIDPSAGTSISVTVNLWSASGQTAYMSVPGSGEPGGIGSGGAGQGPDPSVSIQTMNELASQIVPIRQLDWSKESVDDYIIMVGAGIAVAKVPQLIPVTTAFGHIAEKILWIPAAVLAVTKAVGLYGPKGEVLSYDNFLVWRLMYPKYPQLDPITRLMYSEPPQVAAERMRQQYGQRTPGYGSSGLQYSGSYEMQGGPPTVVGPEVNIEQPGQGCLSDPACAEVVNEYRSGSNSASSSSSPGTLDNSAAEQGQSGPPQ